MSSRKRACPLCGSDEHRTVLELTAEIIRRNNWTYAPDASALLGIADDARFPVVSCARCGLVFALLLPDESFLTALYERVIRPDECVAGSENSAGYARRCRYVADLLELAPTAKTALDFGSGLGVTLRILAACSIEATGFDPSVTRQEYSRGDHATIVTTRGELAGRAPFDLLVLDNVLEHIPDPVEAMAFLRPLCSSNAVAYVSVPAYESDMIARQAAAIRSGAAVDMTLNPWEHLNYFSRQTLDRLMATAGFVPMAPRRAPDIGLRRENATTPRLKNAAASALRFAKWTLRGIDIASAEGRFYRQSS